MSVVERRRPHVLRVLDPTKGDDASVKWNPDNEVEVENAQASFDHFRSQGFLAYKRDKKGGRGVQLLKFDPLAEEIIFAPPLQGG